MLHQLHGTKRVVLYSPDQGAMLAPKQSTHSLAEHGTHYSNLPFPFDNPPPLPAIGLNVTLQVSGLFSTFLLLR